MRFCFPAAIVVAIQWPPAPGALAQTPAEFYKGRSITMLIEALLAKAYAVPKPIVRQAAELVEPPAARN